MTAEEKCLEFLEILKDSKNIRKDVKGELTYHKNGMVYFQYKYLGRYKVLCCSYTNVWSVFRIQYNLGDNQIRMFLKESIFDAFNIVVVPKISYFI